MDVVVDRFGDADHADRQTAPLDLGDQSHRAATRAVAAHDEQYANAELDQAIDHLRRILVAARSAEDRATFVMDLRDRFWSQVQRLVSEVRDHALVAVAEADNLADAVAVIE